MVREWLRKTNRAAMAWSLAGAAASALASVTVLFITFWVAYAGLWIAFRWFFPLSHETRLLLSGGFVVLVTITGLRQNWKDFDPLLEQAELAADMDVTLAPGCTLGISPTTNAIKAAAFELRTVASICNYIMCGGANLLLLSRGCLRRYWRCRSLDLEGCSKVLAFLAAAGKRQSFAEIAQAVPEMDPARVFDDLRYIRGVLFLASEPPGLTLHPDLRSQLSQLASI
jgi:hypothetical protein